jgi:hypothetical protein
MSPSDVQSWDVHVEADDQANDGEVEEGEAHVVLVGDIGVPQSEVDSMGMEKSNDLKDETLPKPTS